MVKWIPSFITTLNIFCGILAIASNDIYLGSIFILLGAFFDLFDGLAARLLNAKSAFGKELDSLADVITFGAAPAYLYFTLRPSNFWNFDLPQPPEHWMYYIPMLFIVAGGALRLAKFNVLDSDETYFKGMAIPATALLLVGLFIGIHFKATWMLDALSFNFFYIGLGIFIFILNLAPFKMFSAKSLKDYPISKFLLIVLVVFFIFCLFSVPKMALFLSMILYIFLSIIFHFSLRK